jgi:Protein of unknown function (DUF1622)
VIAFGGGPPFGSSIARPTSTAGFVNVSARPSCWLELLVAGDIIRTVAAQPNLRSVAILGGIVLIRTFLSFSLEVEITGRWPWQKRTAVLAAVDRMGCAKHPEASAEQSQPPSLIR